MAGSAAVPSVSTSLTARTPATPTVDLVRPGSAVHMDGRFGVPQFLWTSRQGSALGVAASAKTAGSSTSLVAGAPTGIEGGARAHLATYAPSYGIDAAELQSAGNGPPPYLRPGPHRAGF